MARCARCRPAMGADRRILLGSVSVLCLLYWQPVQGFMNVAIHLPRGGMTSTVGYANPWVVAPATPAPRGRRLLAMKVKFDAKEDYYMRLGLTETATLNDIKRAYRRLALKTHPDVNKASDAAEQFKRVCEAYKVLSDADARKQYDLARKYRDPSSWSSYARTGSTGAGARQSYGYETYNPSTGWGGGPPEETAETIDDSFGKIFNDFLGTVASRGGRGFLEDVVDFLENQVDGFSDESSEEFEELLRSQNLSEIQEEVENLNFLLLKLREKLHKAQLDRMMAESEVRNFRPELLKDVDAMEKRTEKVEREAALRARCLDLEGHIKRADKRQRRLMLRAEELRWGPGGSRPAYARYEKKGGGGTAGSASSSYNTAGASTSSSSSSTSSSSSRSSSASSSSYSSGPSSSPPSTKRADKVEEELQRLKKQMGL